MATDPDTAASPEAGQSRRTVLEVAGVALVAGAAGYVGFAVLGPPSGGGDAGSGGTGPEDEPAETEDEDRSGPGGGGDDESDDGRDDDEDQDDDATATAGATAAGGAVLAAVADVPDGGDLVLEDEDVVLTRSGDTVHAFSATCTHQGCTVGDVRDGAIRCPCHGSAFDPATGAVVNGPAQDPLPRVEVVVQDGQVRRA